MAVETGISVRIPLVTETAPLLIITEDVLTPLASLLVIVLLGELLLLENTVAICESKSLSDDVDGGSPQETVIRLLLKPATAEELLTGVDKLVMFLFGAGSISWCCWAGVDKLFFLPTKTRPSVGVLSKKNHIHDIIFVRLYRFACLCILFRFLRNGNLVRTLTDVAVACAGGCSSGVITVTIPNDTLHLIND